MLDLNETNLEKMCHEIGMRIARPSDMQRLRDSSQWFIKPKDDIGIARRRVPPSPIISHAPLLRYLGYRGGDLNVTREEFYDLDFFRYRDRDDPFTELVIERSQIEDTYLPLTWWDHYGVAYITAMRHIKRIAQPAHAE